MGLRKCQICSKRGGALKKLGTHTRDGWKVYRWHPTCLRNGPLNRAATKILNAIAAEAIADTRSRRLNAEARGRARLMRDELYKE